MNRVERGPLLLIVAGVLMLMAVVAYAIHDAENWSRRIEMNFARRAIDDQTRRSLTEMKTIRDQHARVHLEQQQVERRQAEILERLRRIEAMLEGQSPPGSPSEQASASCPRRGSDHLSQ